MKLLSILILAVLLIVSASAFRIRTNTDASFFPEGWYLQPLDLMGKFSF